MEVTPHDEAKLVETGTQSQVAQTPSPEAPDSISPEGSEDPEANFSRPRWQRILAWTGAGTGVCLLLATLTIVATVWWYGRGADQVDPEALLDYHPPQVTRVLARDGTVIGELFVDERRTVVPYEDLPEHLVRAFLAAEDADFFEHDGLDWPGIVRASFTNLVHGEARQGASTITQQVIKNTLLSHSRSVERKSQELVLAGRVEAVLSKRQILEIYVNEVYLGEGRYGVEEAARWYFGKSAAELDLGEAAVLAALPRAPGVITPYRRVDELEARRDYVLRQMVEHEFIEAEAAEPFLGQPIQGQAHASEAAGVGEAEEFVALARAELERRYGPEALATLGATVRTSVDLEVQREARSAARRQLAELEARHGYGSHARPLAERARKRLEARAPARLEAGDLYTVILAEDPEAEGGEARFIDGRVRAQVGGHAVEIELPEALAELPEAGLSQRFPAGAAIEVRITSAGTAATPALAALEPGPELALALADVRSGELLALIAGREFRRGEFDRVHQARRQPGSAFKPVVYGAALRSKAFTAASTGRGGPKGEPMRLREALAQSDNAVALALMRALGPEPVHAFARDLGIESPLGPHLSLALGTSELTPAELLTAYLTLARGGVGIEPEAILEVEVRPDLQGRRPQPRVEPEAERARLFGVEADVSAVLTSMMTSVVREGTGKRAAALGRPVAGKTGTTDDARDAWFAGFTADHAAAVWVGFDAPRSLGRRESGSRLALPIWLAAMESASEGRPVRDFDLPPGVTRALVDARSGGPACRESRHWYEAERCTEGWFFSSCTPARWREHAPYLRCVAPKRWVDELFVAGTEPGPEDLAPGPIGERPLLPDPNERGGEAPEFARASLSSLSLFPSAGAKPAPDPEAIREQLAPLDAALERRWLQALTRAEAERARAGWPPIPAGTKLGYALRLRPDGSLDELRALRANHDELLAAWAESAMRLAVGEAHRSLPAALIEPAERRAEIQVELVVGELPQP